PTPGVWFRPFWRNGRLVGEVALSLVVLIGAGLLVNSFLRLQHVQPVIAKDKLLTAEIDLSKSRYREPAQIASFFQETVRRLEGLPGVEAASFGTAMPLSGAERNDPFAIEGRSVDPSNPNFAGWQVVGAKYFQTL